MKLEIIFINSLLLFWSYLPAQNWSSWTSIQNNNNNAVQYSYKLNPVSSGNSFSLKNWS